MSVHKFYQNFSENHQFQNDSNNIPSTSKFSDLEQANSFYKSGSDHNAQFQSDFFCKKVGTNVRRSVKVFKDYQEGAAHGCNLSRYEVAICYLEGRGVEKSFDKGIGFLRLAALNGIEEAQVKLADVLEEVRGINDISKISLGKRFIRLAEKYQENHLDQWERVCLKIADDLAAVNDPSTQYRLALYYHKGSSDFLACEEKAFKYFKKAADQGSAPAQYAVGKYFQLGKKCPLSWQEAIKYFKMSADQGNAQSLFELGCCYEKGLGGLKQSDSQALDCFKLSANYGYARAQCAAGLYFERGRSIEKSLEQAFHYFKLASNQKDAEGYYHVGRFYFLGRRSQDRIFSLQRAICQYKLAQKQGFRVSRLARLMKHCQNFIDQEKQLHHTEKKTPHKNFENLNLLEKQTITKTQFRKKLKGQESFILERAVELFELAKKLELSGSTLFKKIVHDYEIAAQNGYDLAQVRLGIAYFKGELGLKKDEQKAFGYLLLAADQGYLRAQFTVANCYQKGLGVEKSLEKAFKYFKLAAEQGDAKSQFYTALYLETTSYCLSNESEFKGNLEQAIKYYEFALNQGYQLDRVKLKIQKCKNMIAKGRKGFSVLSISPSQIKEKLETIFGIIERFGDISLISRPEGFIPDPRSQKINIQSYMQDHNLLTLRKIFDSYQNDHGISNNLCFFPYALS